MMLSRIRSLRPRSVVIATRVAAESTSSEGQSTLKGRVSAFARRVRSTQQQAPAASPAPPTAPGPTSSTNATAVTAATSQQQAQSGFDLRKFFRIGMMLFGASIFLNSNIMDSNNPNSFVNRMMNPKVKKNLVLKVERLDDTLAAYDASFAGASKGMKAAVLVQQRQLTAKALNTEISSLSDDQIKELLAAGKLYRTIMKQHSNELERLRGLQLKSIRLHCDYDDLAHLQQLQHDDPAAVIGTAPVSDDQIAKTKSSLDATENDLRALTSRTIQDKVQVELAFMRAIERILLTDQKSKLHLREKPEIASKIKDALLGHEAGYEFIMDKLAKVALLPSYKPHKVFVLTFKGDMQAKQVALLRDEITAVLSLADPSRDKVVVQLDSGGGTVTGYGLGAAQLQRIKNAGLPLIVAIDEVAASGGYMMACVADKIVASPFAILGSVGVVATIPNFSERLTREGVAVEDVTAGKYKRTLTPYKKATAEDRAKVKSEVEDVLTLFKDFVKSNRPQLDLEKIATGETWYGPRAKEMGLVDELRTVDDLLMTMRSEGADVFSLALKPTRPTLFGENDAEMSSNGSSLWGQVKDYVSYWLIQTISSAVQQTIFNSGFDLKQSHQSREQQMMAVDLHQHPRL